jgi:membrane-associated phospholipid phosphatase
MMSRSRTPTKADDYEPVSASTTDTEDILLADLELGALEIDGEYRNVSHGLADGISFLQITIRRPYTSMSVLAILWSLIPYIISVSGVVTFAFLARGSITNGQAVYTGHSGFFLYYLVLAVSGVLLNEKVLKPRYKERRPPRSASRGFGMPSGHCTNSYAWMIWWILEAFIHPGISQFLVVVSALILLAPVPFARVYLDDHTPRQALIGCVIGTCLGVAAIPIRSLIFPNAIPLWVPVY